MLSLKNHTVEQIVALNKDHATVETHGQIIARLIQLKQPFCLSKVGCNEMYGLYLYYANRARGKSGQFSYHPLHLVAGVFPDDPAVMARWAEYFSGEVLALEYLSSPGLGYRPFKQILQIPITDDLSHMRYFHEKLHLVPRALEPYYSTDPSYPAWSQELCNLRVLVMSPFVDSIRSQYEGPNRSQIWAKHPKGAQMLPNFTLSTIKVPLSKAISTSAPNINRFEDWFQALDWMTQQMSQLAQDPETDWDIVLIGAGAFSIPLAAHAKKKLGKMSIALGGALQILFGIKGKRWDKHAYISQFFNDAWIRPSGEEAPPQTDRIENGAYW